MPDRRDQEAPGTVPHGAARGQGGEAATVEGGRGGHIQRLGYI